jgi:hypothetical protein
LRELPHGLQALGWRGGLPKIEVHLVEFLMAVSDAANHRLATAPGSFVEARVHEFQYTAAPGARATAPAPIVHRRYRVVANGSELTRKPAF